MPAAVLHDLMLDGVLVVTLALDGVPDGRGHVKLTIRKCGCQLCQQSAPPVSVCPTLATTDDQ